MKNNLLLKKRSKSIVSYLALFILADLLLFPVPRIFGISLYKPSYWILFSWPLFILFFVHRGYFAFGGAHRFMKFSVPIFCILVFGLLGQLYLLTLGEIGNHSEAFRATVFYLMMIFAFGYGQLVADFNYGWLLWLFYSVVALVFLLLFAIDRFPIFAHLYYISPEKIEKLSELVSSQSRYRGLSNPNSTMLLVNIIFLFLVISYRLGYINKLAKIHILIASTINLTLCFLLASRNQMIVSAILVIFFVGAAIKKKKTYILILIEFLFVISILILLLSSRGLRENYSFIDNSYNRFITTELFNIKNKNIAETILRPFLEWQIFWDRFLLSPIIGSGYSTLNVYPFDVLPYFHNDWFRVWVTSGAIGGIFLLIWMLRIAKHFGLLLLLPFFLPGLTNSFLRNTPAILIYCFMMGLLIEKKFRETASITVGTGGVKGG